MRFGLIMRGQYPQGDDMRVRLKEDLDEALNRLHGQAGDERPAPLSDLI